MTSLRVDSGTSYSLTGADKLVLAFPNLNSFFRRLSIKAAVGPDFTAVEFEAVNSSKVLFFPDLALLHFTNILDPLTFLLAIKRMVSQV